MQDEFLVYGTKDNGDELIYLQKGFVSQQDEKDVLAQAKKCGYTECRVVRYEGSHTDKPDFIGAIA